MTTTTTKPPYDPVKTVEGMFNGSVTRIAYAMKDPLNYAQSTKAVLAETAKKFQDALDDCEIQILDAKWYLERQLALNKARREAKAREDSAASAKRKREELEAVQDQAPERDNESAPKRVKTQEPEESAQPQQGSQPTSQPSAINGTAAQPPAKPTENDKPAATNAMEKPKVSAPTEVKAPKPSAAPAAASQSKDKPPEPAQPPESNVAQTTVVDEVPKATPQETPVTGNDEFNFVSMFGEPSGEMGDGTGNDMSFDLGLGEGFDGDGSNLNAQDSFSALLPGLESYANQTGDDSGFPMPAPGATTNLVPDSGGQGGDDTTITANNNNQQQLNANDFSLPALGPNEFDDFLNANDMSFDGNINMDDDVLLNAENMEMDFDSMFG